MKKLQNSIAFLDRFQNVARDLHYVWYRTKEYVMTKNQLQKKVAYLESINDQLTTEVSYVDHLMRVIGFADGLVTMKATAQEIIDKGLNNPKDDNS